MEENKLYTPVLICDIGGTNARMRITKISKNFGEETIKVDYKKLVSNDYQSLLHLCQSYLEEFVGTENYPIYAVIAVPGPIENNVLKMTANIPHWKSSNGDEIAKSLGINKCILLNDFVVIGYGITGNITLNKDYFCLHNFEKVDNKSVYAVIGPGTGLGHGLGYKTEDSKYHKVSPSEGGHITFSAFNDVEWRLKKYFEEKLNLEHISQERICSGPGIPYIYNFLIDVEGLESKLIEKTDPDYDKKRFGLTPEEIVLSANTESCPVSVATRKIFVEIFATLCANICLAVLPYKGLFLVGSIFISFLEYIKQSDTFINRFYSKGRVSNFLKDFPIFAVVDPHIGLKGCEEYGRRLIEKS